MKNKYLIVALAVIIVLIIGVKISNTYKNIPSNKEVIIETYNKKESKYSQPQGSELIDSKCQADQCLTKVANQEMYGSARVTGYFTKKPSQVFDTKKVCDAFTITGGSEVLRTYFLEMIDMGNTVNTKNENGDPVVNIDLSKLSNSEKNVIVNSSANNPADIAVLVRQEPGRDAPICFSFFDILGAR